MSTDRPTRTEGMFTNRGREYLPGERFAIVLRIEEARRRLECGLKTAIADVVDKDARFKRLRLTGDERDAAIESGHRRYHQWRPAILSECDVEQITKDNFRGMPLENVTIFGLDPFEGKSGNAVLRPTLPRGRPKKFK